MPPQSSTRTNTLFPYTTLFRSARCRLDRKHPVLPDRSRREGLLPSAETAHQPVDPRPRSPMTEHVRSWYAASANPHAPFPTLEGETRCDVLVVGGGYTGLSAALNLAARGYDVVLLESQRVGRGASGRQSEERREGEERDSQGRSR